MKNFTRVFIGGDVCGELGLKTLQEHLPVIIKKEKIDFCVVNGENTANGVGITEEEAELFFSSGVDVITGGNHTLEKFNIRYSFGENERILRPHNFPFAQGSGIVYIKKEGVDFVVINLEGRENMRPIDCPFQTIDKIFNGTEFNFDLTKTINILDFHAESTMEKEALAFYLDGKVSVFAGTHTHTQTADERILPNGTAYITDAGMIGSKDSAIGGSPDAIIERTKTQVPQKITMRNYGDSLVCGLIADIDIETKKAIQIKRFMLNIKTDN